MTTDNPTTPGDWGGPPVDLRDYVSMLKRWRWLVLSITVTMIALAAVYSYTREPVYTAQAAVFVRPVLTSPVDPSRPGDISAETETRIATSAAVADLASLSLGSAQGPGRLLANVEAEMTEGSAILTITYAAPRPAEAQAGARAMAEAYLAYRQQAAQATLQLRGQALTEQIQDNTAAEEELTSQINSLPEGTVERGQLQARLQGLETAHLLLQNQFLTLSSLTTNAGEVIDPATLPTAPSSPNHTVDLLLGCILGFGLGVGTGILKDRLAHRLRTAEALEEALGSPVIGSIPRVGYATMAATQGCLVELRPQSSEAASYRTLRTGVAAFAATSQVRSLAVTSAREREGKTMTAMNLAVSLAELGRPVVLVSADLRRPRLTTLFDLEGRPGLYDVLHGTVSPSEAVYRTHIADLSVVPSGTIPVGAEPANLLGSERMRALLVDELAEAEHIIIDTPPVLGLPDTLLIAQITDGVLIVANASKTDAAAVILTRRQLERAGGRVVGAVLTESEGSIQYSGDPKTGGRKASTRRWPFARRERGRPRSLDRSQALPRIPDLHSPDVPTGSSLPQRLEPETADAAVGKTRSMPRAFTDETDGGR